MTRAAREKVKATAATAHMEVAEGEEVEVGAEVVAKVEVEVEVDLRCLIQMKMCM